MLYTSLPPKVMRAITRALLAGAAVGLATTRAAAMPPLVLERQVALPPGGTLVERAERLLRGTHPARTATLRHLRTVDSPVLGRVVRFEQVHAGLPVIGRGATVAVERDVAAAHFAAARLEPAIGASPVPAIAASQAAARARAATGLDFDSRRAALAWLPRAGSTRLVWTFYEGLIPGTAVAPAVAVDARHGDVLLAYNAVRSDREATVFLENPVSTPTPETVTLTDLEPGATLLTSARVKVLNCIDRKSVAQAFGFEMHHCDLDQLAVADANGDFPYEYENDFLPEDEHAEVAMFFHTTRAYDYLSSVGLPDLEEPPLVAVTNFRMAEGLWSGVVDFDKIADPDRELEPLDNAFFSPGSEFFDRVWGVGTSGLWFGQGRMRDFSYDGDVVYHEFGHAAVDRTANLTAGWILDSQGATPAPGAMNEALADYFSSAIAGDSKVGEYVGQAFGMTSIRDIDNDDSCPAKIAGEVHVDSTLFSGGLWAVRQGLPEADREELDRAIMAALVAAPSGELLYEELAELIVTAIEESSLGTAAAEAMRAELESRGVLPVCKRIREWEGKTILGHSISLQFGMIVPGKSIIGIPGFFPYAPGLFQLHVPLDEGTTELEIRWRDLPARGGGLFGSFGGNQDPYEPALLVRFDPEPIEFTSPGIQSNAGDAIDATRVGSRYVTDIEVPKGATDAYVMIVNRGDEDGGFTELRVTLSGEAGGGGASGGVGGSGGGGFGGFGGAGGSSAGGAIDADPDPVDVTPTGGGCACRLAALPAASGGWIGVLLIGAVAVLRRRRR